MKGTALLSFAILLSGCAGRMPLVGLDGANRPILQRVSEARYIDHLAEGLVSIQQSVYPALNAVDTEEHQWRLRTAVVGFSVKAEAGIGPFKVGIRPRIRACFANGEKPPIP